MKMQIGFTMDWASFWSRQIVRIVGGLWSHCLVMWTIPKMEMEALVEKGVVPRASTSRLIQSPDGMYRFYFESHWNKDAFTEKSGWRGPYQFLKLTAWVAENPKKHQLELNDVPTLSTDRLEKALKLCFAKVGVWTYGKKQIVLNWRGHRFKLGIPIWMRSKDSVTCSEGTIRIAVVANADYVAEVYELGDVLYDEYVPSSRRFGGIYESMDKAERKAAQP